MADIQLTAEERTCLMQVATAPATGLAAVGAYLPYLAPVAILGTYGVATGDAIAAGLAFACLFLLNCWWIAQQRQQTELLISVAQKVLRLEHRTESEIHPSEKPDAPTMR